MNTAEPPRPAVDAPHTGPDSNSAEQAFCIMPPPSQEHFAGNPSPEPTPTNAEDRHMHASPAARQIVDHDPAMAPTVPGLAIWVTVVGLLFLIASISSFLVLM